MSTETTPDGVGFCTECGKTIQSWEGLTACPHCGTRSVPCAHENQVSVSVNWHELRVLVMWAENWQREHNLGRSVYSIAKRIAVQHPDHAARSPLTLAEDIGLLAKHHEVSVSSAALRRDIAEQTGEETGLARFDELPPDDDYPAASPQPGDAP